MFEDKFKMNIKNIWVCGIGGVGGYFGGLIAYHSSKMENNNYKVFFLARGTHLNAIKENGLELHTSNDKILRCKPTLASDDINDFPPPDLCLICVKSYDLNSLIHNIKDKLNDDTIIIPLMNGIDIYERIRENLKMAIVFPTCVYVGSHIERPGLVIQTGNPGFFNFGPDPLNPNFQPKDLLAFFEKMKIESNLTKDPKPAIWKKYLLVASFALVTAHTGLTLGGVIDNPETIDILRKIMKEIVLIAKRKSIELPKDIIEDTITFCKDYPDVKTSYQRDIGKGKDNEGDLFGGTIIRLGKELGAPTPLTEKIYKKIKNKELI